MRRGLRDCHWETWVTKLAKHDPSLEPLFRRERKRQAVPHAIFEMALDAVDVDALLPEVAPIAILADFLGQEEITPPAIRRLRLASLFAINQISQHPIDQHRIDPLGYPQS